MSYYNWVPSVLLVHYIFGCVFLWFLFNGFGRFLGTWGE